MPNKAIIALAFGIACSALLGWVIWREMNPPFIVRASFTILKDWRKVLTYGSLASVWGLSGRFAIKLGSPIELEMYFERQKSFALPRNAKERLGTEGVLGPTNVNIDLVGASGPPVENNGRLEVVEYKSGYLSPEAAAKLKKVVNDLIDEMTAHEAPADQTPSPQQQINDK